LTPSAYTVRMLDIEATRTPRLGAIVAWWERSVLTLGLVAAEEKQRLRLVRSRGKDERVKPGRIVAVVAHDDSPPGDDPASRARARGLVAVEEQRLRETADRVEVTVVWDIIREGLDGATGDTLSIHELAELALESSTGRSCAAVTLALVEDGLHFVRKGQGWDVREPAAVCALRDERSKQAQRESETREFLSGLADAVAGGPRSECGTETERRYMDALERLAVHGDEIPEATRRLALEALEASRLRSSRPAEGAFRVLRKLGRFDSDDENLQVRRFGLRTTFPEAVRARAAERRARGFARDGRKDLTALVALSIDSPHTREIDDLLSVEPRRGGGFRLGVHIADPSAFIEPGDAVDEEALTRGVTHYMPDMRLPMLPPDLSEEAASLVAGEERPALSFLVDLEAQGSVVGFEITPSVVRSARRLDYEQADRMIVDGDAWLARLAHIGALRQQARESDGAIVFRCAEVDVHVDESRGLQLERISADSPSRLAVSEAMVLAGQVAARFCGAESLPVGYRRQASPAEPPDLPPGGATDPVVVRRVRRQMRRAEIGLEPGPHAGLGLEAYVQASSPLRRYQDLAVHRQILSRLRNRRPCYDAVEMRRIVSTTERAEADARRAEEVADEFWLLRYLERFVGRSLAATVVELDPRPIVKLDETLREQPVKGLTAVEPGQRIQVEVVRVEPRAGILSLRPVD